MNVPTEGGGIDRQFQPPVQEINVTVQAVIGSIVAVIDERVGTLDDLHLRVILIEGCDKRIVFPQFGATGANIGFEPARVTTMKIPNRGGHHDNIARRKKTFENELSHGGKQSDAPIGVREWVERCFGVGAGTYSRVLTASNAVSQRGDCYFPWY